MLWLETPSIGSLMPDYFAGKVMEIFEANLYIQDGKNPIHLKCCTSNDLCKFLLLRMVLHNENHYP